MYPKSNYIALICFRAVVLWAWFNSWTAIQKRTSDCSRAETVMLPTFCTHSTAGCRFIDRGGGLWSANSFKFRGWGFGGGKAPTPLLTTIVISIYFKAKFSYKRIFPNYITFITVTVLQVGRALVVVVWDGFHVSAPVIQGRVLRHNQKHLLERLCDGICKITKKFVSCCFLFVLFVCFLPSFAVSFRRGGCLFVFFFFCSFILGRGFNFHFVVFVVL